MKIVKEFLYESLVGTWETFDYNNKSREVNVYKNPQTLKNMEKWCRAITDLRGNLYVAESSGMIHIKLYEFLCANNELPGGYYSDYKEYWGYKNSLAWQRNAGTNQLYLAESYNRAIFDEADEYYADYAQARRSMNAWRKTLPKILGIKFVWEIVPNNFSYNL